MDNQLSWHQIATALTYVVVAIIGWAVRTIWEAVRELERELPVNYVRKEDYRDSMDEIRVMFQRIFDKLDDKADKKSS